MKAMRGNAAVESVVPLKVGTEVESAGARKVVAGNKSTAWTGHLTGFRLKTGRPATSFKPVKPQLNHRKPQFSVEIIIDFLRKTCLI